MAVVPGPAVAITGPGTYQVPYPGGGTQPQGAPHQWTQLKLENASPFPMTVYLGGTPVHSLPAGIADVFPLTLGPGGPGQASAPVGSLPQPITVAAGVAAAGVAAAAGTLRPSWGQYGDLFPGVYPVSLPGVLVGVYPVATGATQPGSFLQQTQLTVPASPGGAVSTPILSLINTATVLVASSASAVPLAWDLIWFADPLGASPLGNAFGWQSFTVEAHLLPIATQGPYMAVTVQAMAGGPASASVTITGFPDAADPRLVTPAQAALQLETSSVPASGNTGFLLPTAPYIPGRYHIWASSTQVTTWRIQGITTSNTNQIWYQGQSSPGVDLNQDFTLPASDWQLTGINTTTTAETVNTAIIGPT